MNNINLFFMITGRVYISILLYPSAGQPGKSCGLHYFHTVCQPSLYQSSSDKNIPILHLRPTSPMFGQPGDATVQTGTLIVMW